MPSLEIKNIDEHILTNVGILYLTLVSQTTEIVQISLITDVKKKGKHGLYRTIYNPLEYLFPSIVCKDIWFLKHSPYFIASLHNRVHTLCRARGHNFNEKWSGYKEIVIGKIPYFVSSSFFSSLSALFSSFSAFFSSFSTSFSSLFSSFVFSPSSSAFSLFSPSVLAFLESYTQM